MEQHSEAESIRRERERDGGEQLAAKAAAELARAQRDEHDREHPGEHAGEAQGDERRARHVDHEPADDRRRRGEVDVAERQVPGRLQEVQLVAIPAVATEERQREAELQQGGDRAGEQRRAQGSDVRTRVGHDARRLGRRRFERGGVHGSEARPRPILAASGIRAILASTATRRPGDSRVILEDDDFRRFAGVG